MPMSQKEKLQEEKEIDTLRDALDRKNKKLTPQRQMILNVFEKNPREHLSAEEVYDIVRKDSDINIGLATIYRTLDLLTETGLLTSIELDGVNCYEKNRATPEHPHQHHHLICLGCGKVLEVDSPLTTNIEHRIREKTGFLVQDHETKFFGYCEDCQKKMAVEGKQA